MLVLGGALVAAMSVALGCVAAASWVLPWPGPENDYGDEVLDVMDVAFFTIAGLFAVVGGLFGRLMKGED